MTDTTTSTPTPMHKLSDNTVARVLKVVFFVLSLNVAILMLAGVISYTDVDLTPLYPIYQTFAWYVILPTLLVGVWFGMEKFKRNWDKKQAEKRAEAARIRAIQKTVHDAELERFMKMTPDEKIMYIVETKGWL